MGTTSIQSILHSALGLLAGLLFVGTAVFLFDLPGSHLFLPGSRVDLGDIMVGASCEKAFPIFNHSSTAVEIASWTPTCRCVQARFPQTLLLPGQSVNAYVRSQATTPLGRRAAVIALRWHFVGENVTRTDNLVVSARYVSPLSLSEDHVVFWDVPCNEVRTTNIYVQPGNETGNWNSLDAAPASSRLSAQVRQTSSGFSVSMQIDPRGLPPGVWKSTVRLFTLQNGTKTGAETDVPVMAKIEGPYSAFPPVLQFFRTNHSSLDFRLEIHSSTIAIHKLELLDGNVQKPSVKIINSGEEAIVTGSLPKPVAHGMFVGKIHLQINDTAEGSVQVPFIGYPG